jgi:thiamine-monophosphate kinase
MCSVRSGDVTGRSGRCDISGQPDEPSAAQNVADLGEFGLIARVTAGLPMGSDVAVGPGDDAAVVRTPDGRVVVSTDLLIEGRHFRRDWSTAYDVGRRAAAASLADVAAMGARPTALVVGFGAPPELPVTWADEVVAGLRDEAALCSASVVGGDVVRADAVTLAVTALGDLAGRDPVTRSGARSTDRIYVCGRLGYAAAGLALLRSGDNALIEKFDALVAAHRRPTPPYRSGRDFATAGASSMIDVSDGLVADLGHVARASSVMVEIETRAFERDPMLGAAADALGVHPLEWVLTGGDDHALVATLPAGATAPDGALRIGSISGGSGVRVTGYQPFGATGHEHFT